MKIFFTLILSFSFGIASSFTKHQIDSLNSLPYDLITGSPYKYQKIFEQAIKDAEKNKLIKEQAASLEWLSTIYQILGKNTLASDAALKAMKIYEKLDDKNALANVYGRYANGQRRRNVKVAIKYLKLGIDLAEKYNLENVKPMLYEHYGVIFEEAGGLDSALYFYNKALAIKRSLKDTIGIPFALNRIASIYALKKNFEYAEKFLAESDSFRNRETGDFGKAFNLILHGEIEMEKGNAQQALYWIQKCLIKAKKIKYKDLISYCYLKMSEIYADEGNFKNALMFYKKFVAFKDSISNQETLDKMTELEIAYDTEKKDLQIAKSQLSIKRRNIVIIVTLALLGALLTFTIGFYYFQRLKRERLRRELELKNRLKQSEMERRLIKEKLRISRELHDNIGSQLTFLVSSIDNLTYKLEQQNIKNKLKKISDFGRSTMKELRDSIWAMKNEKGGVGELVLKINELKQNSLLNNGTIELKVENEIKENKPLSTASMLNMFRIIQEALQNAIKHSKATKIVIHFEEIGSGIVLMISDNGKGFNVNNSMKGNGLNNMRERCEEIGGKWKIQSSTNGTHIFCTFPQI